MAVVIQRPLRGSRISSFYPIKNLPSLSSLDSAFQLQEYISLLIRLDVHDVDTIVSVPGKTNKEKDENDSELKGEEKEAEKERKSEIAVDEACWIYEQLRRLAQDLSHPLITMLQQECTRASCPEMKAGEWLYLCVAHGNDGSMEQCCAIDYILHTLDSATALLNSPRAFPSRLSIPQSSHRHFSSLARRLGRIFAHAYFHHREAFEQAEVESSLYARFLALTSKFELVPSEFLVIPIPLGDGGRGRDMDVEPPRLLAASVGHQRGLQQTHDQDHLHVELGGELGVGEWEKANERGKSPPGLADGSPTGDQSPRKYGRNRTDTMVFSEAFNVAGELVKGADMDERELDGGQDGQSPDETAVLEASEASEPEIIIDELEGSNIGPAVPPAEEPILDSHQEAIDPSDHAEASETPEDIAVPPALNPSSGAHIEEASATEPAIASDSTEHTSLETTAEAAVETTVEDVDAHEPKVEEPASAEPEHIAEDPSPICSHVPESETSTHTDAPAVDTVAAPKDATVDAEINEAPPIASDQPEGTSSEFTDQTGSDTITLEEHDAEPAHAEPAAEEAAEVTPEASDLPEPPC